MMHFVLIISIYTCIISSEFERCHYLAPVVWGIYQEAAGGDRSYEDQYFTTEKFALGKKERNSEPSGDIEHQSPAIAVEEVPQDTASEAQDTFPSVTMDDVIAMCLHTHALVSALDRESQERTAAQNAELDFLGGYWSRWRTYVRLRSSAYRVRVLRNFHACRKVTAPHVALLNMISRFLLLT